MLFKWQQATRAERKNDGKCRPEGRHTGEFGEIPPGSKTETSVTWLYTVYLGGLMIPFHRRVTEDEGKKLKLDGRS